MSMCKYCGRLEPHHHIACDRPMTKPEGDVALLMRELLAECPNFPAACDCAESRAADLLESQATRIATLTEALERARGCIKGLCARTPVRDVAETLAEIDSALSAGQGGRNEDHA